MTSRQEQQIKKKNAQLEKELAEATAKLRQKNGELETEAALEKVRAVAMSMKEPADMLEICKTISLQLKRLGVKEIRNVQTAIFYEERGTYMNYQYYAKHDKTFITDTIYTDHDVARDFATQMLRGKGKFYIHHIEGRKKLDNWIAYQKSTNVFIDEYLYTASSLSYYWYSLGPVALGISTYFPLTETEENLFKRFLNVFGLAYRRYLDIEKAEVQAREAEIELGLERVRARAMAMQKSDELSELADTVFKELTKLDFALKWCIINIIDEPSLTNTVWAANPDIEKTPESYHMKFEDYPFHHAMMKGWKERNAKCVYIIEGQEKKIYDEYLFNETEFRRVPAAAQAASRAMERYVVTFTFSNFGGLQTVGDTPLLDASLDILSRFGKVFDLTYTRFNDLKLAEAQAREAKIEAALEKVRSRTIGMQKSDELKDVIQIVYEQFVHLNIHIEHTGFLIDYKARDDMHIWLADQYLVPSEVTIPYFDSPPNNSIKEAKEKGLDFFTYHLTFEEKNKFYRDLFKFIPGVPEESLKYYFNCPGLAGSGVLLENIGLYIENFSGIPYSVEDNAVLMRFGKVFQQTYTRFLDLQKAEAQAREAQIEAALERVRAKSMAMHDSENLHEVINVLTDQLLQLGFVFDTASFITDFTSAGIEFWISTPGVQMPDKVFVPQADLLLFRIFDKAVKQNDDFISYTLSKEDKDDFFRHFFRHTEAKYLPEERKKIVFDTPGLSASVSLMKNVFLTLANYRATPYTEEENIIIRRFARVFEQSYTRFLDLKKAETQARAALIEGALERVRARALAMQQPEELKDVAQVMRNEMGALGVEELETSSIYIHGDNLENVQCWYALQDPKHTEKKMIADHFILNLDDTWVGREMKKFYLSNENQTSIVMQGANRREWIEYCYKRSLVFSGFYGDTIPDRTYHLYKFSHGYIGAAAPGDISAESWRLLSRAASVFSLAYSRFRDLTQARNDLIKLKEEKKRAEDALTELQATQKQLIQSEKMASLGELTAGIAHEIQNPLNFVNNFSDVSNELLEEMKVALDRGNNDDVKAIADDVKQNLEKILFHGKRADAIVKGMLQHSRVGSGQKELTDINALCDEYLRLAYHGLRAKDKSFSAKFETDFDKSIGKIEVVPQEIGRVILNLINNAFYAVTERKKLDENARPDDPVGRGYEPIVTIKTLKNPPLGGRGAGIEIRVKDNGNGIPQKVLDKIFQPFFTTKPTGEGTGLGLSLAYDIVTKGHGGEINVVTKTGEGSEFIIQLPLI